VLDRHLQEIPQLRVVIVVNARARLKDRGPGSIFTGGPLWRNSWRHRF